MSEPELIWVKSKWTANQLNGQTLEYQLALKQGGIAYGIGILLVQDREIDDRIAVQILIEGAAALRQGQYGNLLIPVSEMIVDLIEFHPKQEIAKFRVMTP